MQIEHASTLNSQDLQRKLSALHYVKEIRRTDEGQFQKIIEYSRFVYLSSGEFLFKKGDKDRFIYFLMRGELQVCKDDEGASELGLLLPGEVIGEIAVLTRKPRTAHIRVPESVREVVVFGTDFSIFGDLQDHEVITLPTKLVVFRQIVHILRWRNDLYRVKFPNDVLASARYTMPPFSGQPDSQAELEALHAQGLYLANRLSKLNRDLGTIDNRLGAEA